MTGFIRIKAINKQDQSYKDTFAENASRRLLIPKERNIAKISRMTQLRVAQRPLIQHLAVFQKPECLASPYLWLP